MWGDARLVQECTMHGCRKRGGKGGGGAQGAPRNGTSTCRSLISTTLTMTICDIMNLENSKIMLSELLHIATTLNSSYVCHCSTKRTFSAMRRLKSLQ